MNAIANAVSRVRVGKPKEETESNESDVVDSDSKQRAPVNMPRNTVEAAIKSSDNVDHFLKGDDFQVKSAVSKTKELVEDVANRILNDTGNDGEGGFQTRKEVAADWQAVASLYGDYLATLDTVEAAKNTAANALRELLHEENSARAAAAMAEVGLGNDGSAAIDAEDLDMIVEKAVAKGHLFENEFHTVLRMRGVTASNFLNAVRRNKIAPSHGISNSAYELSKFLMSNPPNRM